LLARRRKVYKSTSPGGYQERAAGREERQQFPVCDQRSLSEVICHLSDNGFQVIWNFADF
jgi:hypothetical protein